MLLCLLIMTKVLQHCAVFFLYSALYKYKKKSWILAGQITNLNRPNMAFGLHLKSCSLIHFWLLQLTGRENGPSQAKVTAVLWGLPLDPCVSVSVRQLLCALPSSGQPWPSSHLFEQLKDGSFQDEISWKGLGGGLRPTAYFGLPCDRPLSLTVSSQASN